MQKSETMGYGKIDDVTLLIDKKEPFIGCRQYVQIKRVHYHR